MMFWFKIKADSSLNPETTYCLPMNGGQRKNENWIIKALL